MQINSITDIGNDVMFIQATDDNGQPVCATGWTSVYWNYLPPEAFLPDGSHDPNIPPRYQTPEELLAYATERLAEVGTTPHEIPNVIFQA